MGDKSNGVPNALSLLPVLCRPLYLSKSPRQTFGFDGEGGPLIFFAVAVEERGGRKQAGGEYFVQVLVVSWLFLAILKEIRSDEAGAVELVMCGQALCWLFDLLPSTHVAISVLFCSSGSDLPQLNILMLT